MSLSRRFPPAPRSIRDAAPTPRKPKLQYDTDDTCVRDARGTTIARLPNATWPIIPATNWRFDLSGQVDRRLPLLGGRLECARGQGSSAAAALCSRLKY